MQKHIQLHISIMQVAGSASVSDDCTEKCFMSRLALNLHLLHLITHTLFLSIYLHCLTGRFWFLLIQFLLCAFAMCCYQY